MGKTIIYGSFEWDEDKEKYNLKTHGIDFKIAALAFFDINRAITVDEKHSEHEPRLYCSGIVDSKVITVRFVYRKRIRIFGAGYWRKGRKIYEEKNKKN